MTQQLDLFRDRATEPSLTARQRFALAFVKARGIVQGDELGAALHEYRMSEGGRGHRAEDRCRFCTGEGADVGKALVRKGLLVRRRGEGFCDPGYRPAVEGHDPSTAPMPEGF